MAGNIINSSVSFGYGSIGRIISASNTSLGLIAFGYNDTYNSGAIAINGKIVSSKILDIAKVEDATNGDYVQITYLGTNGTVQNTSFGIINEAQVQAIVDSYVSDIDEVQNASINALETWKPTADASIDDLQAKDTEIDASIDALQAKDTEIDASIDRLDSSVTALENSMTNLTYVQTIEGGNGIDAQVTSSGTNNITYTISTVVDSSTVFNTGDGLSALSYKIEELGTPTTGYLKSYQLTQHNPSTGADVSVGIINIPKDFLVKSGTVEEVTAPDEPYQDAVVGDKYAVVGDKYIDFVINSKNADDTDSHVYIPVKDLVDVYTGSTYITVNNDNSISLNTTKFETDYINPINQKILNVSTDVSTLDHIVAVMGNDLNDRVADVSQDLIDLTGIVDGLTSGGVMDVSAVKTTANVNVKNADTGVNADTVTNGVATVTLKQQKGTTYSDVITIENLVTKNTIDEIASLLTAAEVRQNRTDSSVNTIETKVTEIDASIDRLDSSVSALENTLRWIELGS